MSKYTVTSSSELMENYIQADILLPQDKFLALQTNAGASLLFSVGTGGVFNLTVESPGKTHGWRLSDLSSAQIKKDFSARATCKDFSAAQAFLVPRGGSAQIHLAMVINDGTNDHLYISLGNSDSDLSWITAPAWTPCPYNAIDATGKPVAAPSPVKICGVFICEATDKEYIVVDLIRNPKESAGVLQRYYLDVTTPSTPKWTPHDVAGDISATGYQSCLGRSAHAYGIDGIFTKGTIGSSAQLLYTPLINAFDPTQPPPPSRLSLPGGLVADSIAASRNADNTSDLYVAAKGGLYYFASSNQKDEAVGVLLTSNPLLNQVNALYAYPAEGNITVWGLNSSNQVFYLTCALAELTTALAWNLPLIIMSGADAISPYIDRSYSANTFFAHGSNGLIKVVKTPGTGIWSEKNITLPPSDLKQDATPLSSYTTHIQVNDANGNAAPNVTVSLTATSVTSVYINHLYYIIGPSPAQVVTDKSGTITIVETVKTLSAARFTAIVGQESVPPINPMNNAFQRNSQYTTDKLRKANIVDRQGHSRSFVPIGTSDDDLNTVTTSNQNLSKAYSSKQSVLPPVKARPVRLSDTQTVHPALLAAGYTSGTLVDIGDLFRWLESAFEAVINFIEDVAEGLWHLVVTIAGEIYHAVLDCVEKIVAAALWLYNAIKVAIEDVIKFLEFLFGWQDIVITHNVLKNFFVLTAQYAIDGIENTKTQIVNSIRSLEGNIDKWAGIPNFDQTQSGTSNSNQPPAGQNDATSNLGVHHFKGNAANASSSAISPDGPVDSIYNDLVNMVNKELGTISNAMSAVQTDVIEPFPTLTTTQIIQKLLAIIADTFLQSAENAITTMLDLVAQLTTGMMDILTATLDIPVLSWLYKDITGNDLSFLDLICLIAAIPATLIYKIASNATPFPGGAPLTVGILNAKSFSDIQKLFFTSSPQARLGATAMALGDVLNEANVKFFSFIFSICAFVGSIILVFVVDFQRFTANLVFPKVLATVACLANLAYVSPNIPTWINVQTGDWSAQINNSVTAVSILKGMAAIPAATSTSDTVSTGFALVETTINALWNVPVIDNIIVHQAAWNTTYKSLIVESIANFAFNVGGMMEIFITRTKDPESKVTMSLVQAGFMVLYGGGITVAELIYYLGADQTHD